MNNFIEKFSEVVLALFMDFRGFNSIRLFKLDYFCAEVMSEKFKRYPNCLKYRHVLSIDTRPRTRSGSLYE